MKLVSFFILSLSVHAAALAFPVALNPRSHQETVRVVLIEIGSIGPGAGNGAEARVQQRRSTATLHKPSTFPRLVGSANVADSEARAVSEETTTKTEKVAKDVEDGLASFSATSDSAESRMDSSSNGAAAGSSNGGAMGSGEQTGQYAGHGGGTGTGTGSDGGGLGIGQGHGVEAPQMTQARLRHAPPPEYPEAARKDGKEGRVLLRVLVDEEGRSKAVDISLSSGSRLLDQAAVETVKHWRFSPARQGDAPTASWVRIPVDFRLKDAK
jgi:periplasmic protein TonB